MKIAAIDVGYVNVFADVYVFKSIILYYIYEDERLINKKIVYDRKVERSDNPKALDQIRLELEKTAIEKSDADYVLIDGNLNQYFYSLEKKFRENKYWIPKTLLAKDMEEENENIIIRTFGDDSRKYRIETFIENKDKIDDFIDVLKRYFIKTRIVYPFILHEVDKLAVVRKSDYPAEVYIMKYILNMHDRILRDGLIGRKTGSLKRKDFKI